MTTQFQHLAAAARDLFGQTVLWPAALGILFVVFAALAARVVDLVLPAPARRGLAWTAATARALAGVLWRGARDALTPPPGRTPRWARRAIAACALCSDGWFAVYSGAWAVVFTAAALRPAPSPARLGAQALGLVVGGAFFALARAFTNAARRDWRRLRA